MDRAQLKAGFFFQVTGRGEIPGLDGWVGAVKRWAFSNPNRKGFLDGPKRVFEKRSDQQNKTVMGLWMDLILDEFGYEQSDKRYIYDTLKVEMGFCDERVNKRTGEVVRIPRETKGLDSAAYSKFMDDFSRHVAMQHGINLPDPVAELARI